MTLTSKEHYDMMDAFERRFPHMRLDREPKHWWAKGRIYQSGEANDAFIAFRHGYSFARATYL